MDRSAITAMNRAVYILLLFLHLHHLTLTSSAVAESPIMFPSAACTDQLVIFSSCLPFISACPNNRTDFPPQQCCNDVAAAFTNGSAICICYFIQEPDILGFPLNSSKLLSLTSICPRSDQTLEANFSLQKLCSESATLPPLHSITGSNNPKPHSTVPESPQDSSGGPPAEQPADDYQASSSAEQPADDYQASSSTPPSKIQKIHWRLPFSLMIGFVLLCLSQWAINSSKITI